MKRKQQSGRRETLYLSSLSLRTRLGVFALLVADQNLIRDIPELKVLSTAMVQGKKKAVKPGD